MKKVSMIAIAILLICVLCGCSSGATFMSASDAKSLVKNYGNPQMKMVVGYKVNDNDVELTLNYELLMDKTPITVVNFINNVNAGKYDKTFFSSRSTAPAYLMAGSYETKDEETKRYEITGNKIIGEFKSNLYAEPEGGYAEVSLLCLAMNHAVSTTDSALNGASTAFIMTTGTKNHINADDYAVFATLKSITCKVNDVVTVENSAEVPSTVLEDFAALSSTTSTSIVSHDDEGKEITTSASLLSNMISVSITLLDKNGSAVTADYWNKLPTKYVIAD